MPRLPGGLAERPHRRPDQSLKRPSATLLADFWEQWAPSFAREEYPVTTPKANFIISFSSRSPGLPGRGFPCDDLTLQAACLRPLSSRAHRSPRWLMRVRSLFARLSQKLCRIFRAPVP
jgi:hypothetical protein